MEKIILKDLITEELSNLGYEQTEIEAALTKLGKTEIINSNTFGYTKSIILERYKIIHINSILDKSINEIEDMFIGPQRKINKNIESLIKLVINEIEETKRRKIDKKHAISAHKNIIKIIQDIKNNNTLFQYLVEDTMYLDDVYFRNNNRQHFKSWKHTKLNMNENEISILKNYLLGKDVTSGHDSNSEEFHKKIINIHHNLTMYVNRMQYKFTVDKNYCDITKLNLSTSETNLLGRIGITKISQIIEYSPEELKNIVWLGKTTATNIEDALKDRNIIFLNDESELIEKLKSNNAGIINPYNLKNRPKPPTDIEKEIKKLKQRKNMLLKSISNIEEQIIELEQFKNNKRQS